MENKVYTDFSEHFWETIKKSQALLSFLPKKTSVTISFNQSNWLEVASILPEISNMENIIMRLRIFWLNDSKISVKRLLNTLANSYPEKWTEIQQIKDNLKILEKYQISMSLNLNNHEYKKIKDLIEYIWHWSLLHDDQKKREHYKILFQGNPFIRDYLYTDILNWILGYIRYVLFELDLLIQNTVFQQDYTREQLFVHLSEFISFKD